MKILALHGFLGQGSDWDQLRHQIPGSEWVTPSLFHLETNLQLSSFDAAVDSLLEELKISQVDLLIGYSFGGRLALEILQKQPQFADRVLLLSTHLGGLKPEAAKEKSARDQQWALKFLTGAWQQNMTEWNSQELFSADLQVSRLEADFDKRKLYLALSQLSVESQSFFLNLQPSVRDAITFVVGEQDQRYRQLYTDYKSSGWVQDFQLVPGGHRLHIPPSEKLVKLVSIVGSAACE